MDKSFENLLRKIRTYESEADRKLIRKAYLLGKKIHAGQKRLSGEPLLSHLLGVANLVADIHLDYFSVIAALLHEAIRKGGLSGEDLKREFGPKVAFYVETLTQLSQTKLTLGKPELAENVRKIFLLFAKDINIALIRLADRVDNLKTLESLSSSDRIWAARQALNFYAPIAEILGVYYFKRELEDKGFSILHPNIYKTIINQLTLDRKEMEEAIEEIKRRLLKELAGEGIYPLKIFGRAKHVYSIWKKLLRYQKEGKIKDLVVKRIYDQMALMVILEEISQCYQTLGVVNRLFAPFLGEFDDYIAQPKPNGYQALHTVVKDEKGRVFEIQIKTARMHENNEYGAAAHFHYKAEERKYASEASLKEIEWRKNLADWSKTSIEEIFGEKVFVLSPKGDVFELPVGATPVDFAYAVHTEIGNNCQGAKVNGRLVPLNYKLRSGEVVEIISSRTKRGPSPDWLNFVVTGLARREIEKCFRKR